MSILITPRTTRSSRQVDGAADSVKHSKEPHLYTARRVIGSIGSDNLAFSQGTFWKWFEGVWERIDDRLIRKEIHKCLQEKFTKGTVDSVLDIVKTEVFRNDGDERPTGTFVNCLNGELHFRNNEWVCLPHQKEKFRISQIPVAHNPEAGAPRFLRFLEEIFENDYDAADKKQVVLELMGYTLLQVCDFEKFVILIGNGANGKSVLLNVVEALCGSKNVSAVKPTDLSNRFQRAHLHGKLANIVTEIAEGSEIADAELKAIVSSELLTAERKHRPPFDFRPYCTCWFGTNHMPHTRDFSNALFRRAIILRFNNSFSGDRCDPNLKDKLPGELAGILNLALAAVGRVIIKGAFTECHSEREAKKEWRLETDQAAMFVEEKCDLNPSYRALSHGIYEAYKKWAEDEGIKSKLNRRNFTQRLQRLGVQPTRGTGGMRMLAGIQIKDFSEGP